MKTLSRRQLLVASFIGLTTSAIGGVSACGQVKRGPCPLTPPQTEGPFYPVEDQIDENNDLTFVSGHAGKAEGTVIYVIGQVQDDYCRPVEQVRVEIWQASAKGRYRHPGDRNNPVPLDQNFQGWGESMTDPEGRYLFKTIHPGQYPAGPGWVRPSHIHFKVLGKGVRELTTQMYFEGDQYLEQDRIFLAVPSAQQQHVIVTSETPGSDFPPDALVYRFNLVVQRI